MVSLVAKKRVEYILGLIGIADRTQIVVALFSFYCFGRGYSIYAIASIATASAVTSLRS
jgi:hypothetical protein